MAALMSVKFLHTVLFLCFPSEQSCSPAPSTIPLALRTLATRPVRWRIKRSSPISVRSPWIRSAPRVPCCQIALAGCCWLKLSAGMHPRMCILARYANCISQAGNALPECTFHPSPKSLISSRIYPSEPRPANFNQAWCTCPWPGLART